MSIEYLDPILVVGTGRCGTSTVAKILHERIGVYMGSSFIPPDEHNLQGYYEDEEFVSLNGKLWHKEIGIQDWLMSVRELIIERQSLRRLWGIKSTRMSDMLGLYLSLLSKPKLIWCQREKEDTIASFVRCFFLTPIEAKNIYWLRTQSIERLLQGRDYLSLDFTERRDEKEIERLIREKYEL